MFRPVKKLPHPLREIYACGATKGVINVLFPLKNYPSLKNTQVKFMIAAAATTICVSYVSCP